MDARRIALLVQTAGRFESEIYISKQNRRINAKSLMGTMALGMMSGEEVTVEVNGADEQEAVSAIGSFLEA